MGCEVPRGGAAPAAVEVAGHGFPSVKEESTRGEEARMDKVWLLLTAPLSRISTTFFLIKLNRNFVLFQPFQLRKP